MDDTFDLLVASLLPSVGPRQVRALAAGPGLAAALRNPAACREVLPDAAVRALAGGQAVARAESERRRALERGLSVIGWHDADYPALLHHTFDPPPFSTRAAGSVERPPRPPWRWWARGRRRRRGSPWRAGWAGTLPPRG
jgi:hypothetical protein